MEGRPRFRRRELWLPPDEWHARVEAEWRGALVLLRRGAVELHGPHGRWRFVEGAVLCFDGIGAGALHNPGEVTALVVGLARTRRQAASP